MAFDLIEDLVEVNGAVKQRLAVLFILRGRIVVGDPVVGKPMYWPDKIAVRRLPSTCL